MAQRSRVDRDLASCHLDFVVLDATNTFNAAGLENLQIWAKERPSRTSKNLHLSLFRSINMQSCAKRNKTRLWLGTP